MHTQLLLDSSKINTKFLYSHAWKKFVVQQKTLSSKVDCSLSFPRFRLLVLNMQMSKYLNFMLKKKRNEKQKKAVEILFVARHIISRRANQRYIWRGLAVAATASP